MVHYTTKTVTMNVGDRTLSFDFNKWEDPHHYACVTEVDFTICGTYEEYIEEMVKTCFEMLVLEKLGFVMDGVLYERSLLWVEPRYYGGRSEKIVEKL